MTNPKMISPAALQAALHDGAEIALLDVREDGEFGEDHLLFATPLPYSRLELGIVTLVPRKDVRIVLCDDGRSGIGQRAAARLAAMGYTDLAVLEGGTEGWKAAGYVLFKGVNVPSKLFGEMVEHAYNTPRITAKDLVNLRESGEDFGEQRIAFIPMTDPGRRGEKSWIVRQIGAVHGINYALP